MQPMARILAAAVLLVALSTTQVAADSFCGNRSDFLHGPRLTVIGLTADQRLVRFKECTPRVTRNIGYVYGLQAPDTALVGIDFRVQDGQLYGVGNGGGIYMLDANTAVATQVSQITGDVTLSGWSVNHRSRLPGWL